MFTLATNSTARNSQPRNSRASQSTQVYSAVSSRNGQVVLVGGEAAPLRISNPAEAAVFKSLAKAGLISTSRGTSAPSLPLGKTA